MVKTVDAKQARSDFAMLLGQVHDKKDTVIVEKEGKPMVAVISFDRYQALVTKRKQLFGVLDRIWSRNRNKPARQAYRDASQAVTQVRTARQRRRRLGA
jgi:prevent-host-death family protein